MKKNIKMLIFVLLLISVKNCFSSPILLKSTTTFCSNWLFQYDTDDYDLFLHPYTVNDHNDITMGEMGVVWDLNSDEIVNLQDFSILSQIDIEKFIEDIQFLRGLSQEYLDNYLEDYMQSLITSITDKEKELDINNLKLFKILLYESDFDVSVYNYETFIWTDFDFILFWETETHYGTIDMNFDFYSQTYEYTYYYKSNLKE